MSLKLTLKKKLADLLGLSVNEYSGEMYCPNPPMPADTGIKKLNIDFPTGEVIACDWPAVGRLQKHLERELDAQYFNIGTATGREAKTRFIAEKFGFISVFVSNSDPYIFNGGDSLIAAHRPYDEELDEPVEDGDSPYQEVAKISTAYWWTTLVDIGALRELAQQYLPENEVQNMIAAVRENSHDHAFFSMPPGRYTMYFDNNHSSLLSATPGTFLEAPNLSEPYFVLTTKDLDLILGLNSTAPSI